MRNCRTWVVVVLFLINLIIGITALCRSFYMNSMLSMDYAGILVGVLAALVTVLIGWQILSIIDFNKRNAEMGQREKELINKFENKIAIVQIQAEADRRSARLETVYLGHLLLLVMGKKLDKIVFEAFDRINQIDESTDLIRKMTYQALKGALPRLLKLQPNFYQRLGKYNPLHFDCVCQLALEEYSQTQDESDYQILELANQLKHQCYP